MLGARPQKDLAQWKPEDLWGRAKSMLRLPRPHFPWALPHPVPTLGSRPGVCCPDLRPPQAAQCWSPPIHTAACCFLASSCCTSIPVPKHRAGSHVSCPPVPSAGQSFSATKITLEPRRQPPLSPRPPHPPQGLHTRFPAPLQSQANLSGTPRPGGR
jgi:hypothetical protein